MECGSCRQADIEAKIADTDALAVPRQTATPVSFATLADNLQAVWTALTTDARLKKRIVRTLIHEVIADIDADASQIVLIIHWIGGVHTELRLPRRRRGQRNSTPPDIVKAVKQLALIANDDIIAGILNRTGCLPAMATAGTANALRAAIASPDSGLPSASDGIEPWLNLTRSSALLDIAPKTHRLAARCGRRSKRSIRLPMAVALQTHRS